MDTKELYSLNNKENIDNKPINLSYPKWTPILLNFEICIR